MKRMVFKKKLIVVGIGAFIFVVMCFTLVQNASIRNKQHERDNKKSDQEKTGTQEKHILNSDKQEVKLTKLPLKNGIFPREINKSVKNLIQEKNVQELEEKGKFSLSDPNDEELPGLQGNDRVRENGEELGEIPLDEQKQKLPGISVHIVTLVMQ